MVIDLSLPLFTGMPVYPGDSEVSIELIQTYEKDGWNMRRLQINGHDGTHVNVPIHASKSGKNLDDYSIDCFYGKAAIFENEHDIKSNLGLIFSKKNITKTIADKIIQTKPPFIGISAEFEFDIEIEKLLLENDIISFENLDNTDLLPKYFQFYGVPLKILHGDGSPVRAFAITD